MNWNQCSDDSWLNDDSSSSQQQKTKQQQSTKLNAEQKNQNQNQQKSQTNKTEAAQKQQQKRQKTYHKDKIQKDGSRRQGKKFPTDSQLLQQYETEKVQESQRLKIINCFQQEQIEMLELLDKDKKLKLRQFKNKKNSYAARFWSKQDLIKFIKEKIEKKYKFKIGIYIQSQNEKQWKAQKQKERAELKAKQNQQKQKQRKQHKDYRDHKGDKPKVQYREKDSQVTKTKEEQKKPIRRQKDDETQPKDNKQKGQKSEIKNEHRQYRKQNSKQQQVHKHPNQNQHKDHKDHKGDDKKPKGPIKSLKRYERVGKMEILTDQAHPTQVVQWIKKQKITAQFNKFTILASGKYLSNMERLIQQIFKSLSYGFISDISQEQCEQKSNQLFQFQFQQKAQPKLIKRSLVGVYIDKVSQQNFDEIQKFNIHIIGVKNNLESLTNFDEKQYLEIFKKNYPKIVSKWQKWTFYAFNKNIPKLLRLIATLKKLLTKNQFNYQVGVQQKLPYIKVQICDLNKTKYKVDTSVINSHLQD